MKINYAIQSNFQKVSKLKFDIIICSSGYETRSSYFISKLIETGSIDSKKICFTFSDRKVISKEKNDAFFRLHNFTFIEISSIDLVETIEICKEIFSEIRQESINVLIDYSSMTKIMYAALVKFFSISYIKFREASVYFTYTQALYSEPHIPQSNLHTVPISLFSTVEMTDKKISLIASLGYEEGKAQGLIEYMQIDSSDIYLFYTSKDTGQEYFDKVKEQNTYILSKISKGNQFEFDLENVTKTFNLLESLCNYLITNSYRVIIAPLGPKVFSLVSILLNLKYHDLTVFRLSTGVKGEPIDKIPDESKEFIILEVNFSENRDVK